LSKDKLHGALGVKHIDVFFPEMQSGTITVAVSAEDAGNPSNFFRLLPLFCWLKDLAYLKKFHRSLLESDITVDIFEQAGEEQCAHHRLIFAERIEKPDNLSSLVGSRKAQEINVFLVRETVVDGLTETNAGQKTTDLGSFEPAGILFRVTEVYLWQRNRDIIIAIKPGNPLDKIGLTLYVHPE